MNYFRPQKLSDALTCLAENEAGIAAGCTDLFALTQSQYLQKSNHHTLVDITAIDELRAITLTNDGVSIGAAVKWSEIIDADLPLAFDGLKAAAREVGSVQIQNSATIGGNLCNASPAADAVPPLLTLDANIELVSTRGSRILPLSQFLIAPRKTALRADEILSAIIVPNASAGGISGFTKLGARKYLVISIVMTAARLVISKNQVQEIALSVGSCSAVGVRLEKIETALRNLPVNMLLDETNMNNLISYAALSDYLSPIDDIRANAGYRIEAAREMIIRLVTDLVQKGSG